MTAATYARYSSSNQREASIEDQLRDNGAMAARMGLQTPLKYVDTEISGERKDRPGYMRLLADAQQGKFKVLLLWDLKRLSRSEDLPQVLARFKFWGVRIITCDAYDSSQEGSDIRGWVDGMMGNRYLKDLAKATHRGLTGRALAGASAGGLPFGYSVGGKAGDRAVDSDQATVVRRIFAEYLAGGTPRSIAAGLNRDSVPSARAGKTWAASAIHGDVKRGIGILANPIYMGRQVWNRSRWIKHPDTGRRIRQERPREDWIEQTLPELAIVDRATWDAVQARIKRQGAGTGKRGGPGRPPKYLLSGLLRCEGCGGPLVMVDAKAYACSVAKERGTCSSKLRLPRREAEAKLLAGIQQQLLSDEAFAVFRKAYAAAAKSQKPDTDGAAQRMATAERERANLMAALRAGIITPGTKAELLACEARVVNAQAELERMRAAAPARLVPQLRERWDGIVAALAQRARNMPAARDALRELIGEAIVRNENGAILLEITPCPINVVAGAGFEPATFGL